MRGKAPHNAELARDVQPRDGQTRLAELRAEANDVTAQLRKLETAPCRCRRRAAGRTAGPSAGSGRLPDEQALFTAFRLEIRCDPATNIAHGRATLTGKTLLLRSPRETGILQPSVRCPQGDSNQMAAAAGS